MKKLDQQFSSRSEELADINSETPEHSEILNKSDIDFSASENPPRHFSVIKVFAIIIGALVLVAALGLGWDQYQKYIHRNDPIENRHPVKKTQNVTQGGDFSIVQKEETFDEMMKECYMLKELRFFVFFVWMDSDDLTKQEAASFFMHNNVCNFQVLDNKSFDYYVDLWNQREEEIRFGKNFIKKEGLNRDEKRALIIWLKLYFNNAIYVHMKLGVNYGYYINKRYLTDIQVGKQLAFGEFSHRNQKGVFVPERKFMTVKNGDVLSENIYKIISMIIAKQDYFSFFEDYQAIIIKDAVQYPDGWQKTAYVRNPSNKKYPCPLRHNISYIWLEGQLPSKYKQFMDRCRETTRLVTKVDLLKYQALWNQKFPEYWVRLEDFSFIQQIDFLKRLHLFFEGGIYSDFDTVIDETCWEKVITDQVIFTNSWTRESGHLIPEQNFIRVLEPFNPNLQNWIVQHIHELRGFSNRWDACRLEQCFIATCQVHNYDNSWNK